jgi:hypothetical protein
MKERIDKVLRWSIYLYPFLIIAGIYSDSNNLYRGIWDLVNTLNLIRCNIEYGVCSQEIDYFQFFILGGLVLTRYLVFGKTYQK